MTPDATPKRPSALAREAFFDAFSQRARWLLSTLPPSTLPSPAPLILLTGGLRTRTGIARALSTSTKQPAAADLAGLARPAAADPFLPLSLLSSSVPSSAARAPAYDSLYGVRWLRALLGWVAVAGPGLDVLWHTMALRQVALRRAAERKRGVEQVQRVGAGDYELCGFWRMAWRTWVVPAVPSWFGGIAAALVFAVIGRGWKWA